jgi:DNA-binding PadR family transcriptional regulator
MKILLRADELTLLTVWRLQSNAYGVTIRKHIINTTGSDWSVGAIYDSLERLTNWGYLEAFQADPTPERGGRSKRYYKLTKAGLESLVQIRHVQESMWKDLPDPGFDIPHLAGGES